jgi:hypothetical protein
MAGSKGKPGAADGTWLNNDGRNGCVPGGGNVTIIL